jgi:hypothetical protein
MEKLEAMSPIGIDFIVVFLLTGLIEPIGIDLISINA